MSYVAGVGSPPRLVPIWKLNALTLQPTASETTKSSAPAAVVRVVARFEVLRRKPVAAAVPDWSYSTLLDAARECTGYLKCDLRVRGSTALPSASFDAAPASDEPMSVSDGSAAVTASAIALF